jgi:hypothetical protein
MRKYKTFNYPNYVVGSKTLLTGIRKKEGCENIYLISGFYEPNPNSSQAISFLYEGKLNGKGKWMNLSFHDKNTNLYGPNYSPNSEIEVVGNYFSNNTSNGCLLQMQSAFPNSKKWTIIIPPFGNTINTIVHSNSEGLAVGNYELMEEQVSKAFIYNIQTGNYYRIEKTGALSISAYGIVHVKKDKYCICGGFIQNLDSKAFLVDFDRKTKSFSNWREYTFNNERDVITHFDGISLSESGYTLTGDYVNLSNLDVGFFCKIDKKGKATWESVHYPHSLVTSGNSVANDVVIGVYVLPNHTTVNGYVSKF